MSNVSPFQPKLLSKINERLVLRMIQERGPSTRSEMSKYIGVTFPTVAKAVSSLLESQLLEEIDDASAGPGRPAKRLRLASENSQVIGITLSGDECTVVAGDLNGTVHKESVLRFPTPATYELLLAEIETCAKSFISSSGKSTLGVGVSVPAVIDYGKQVAIMSANLPLVNGKSIGKDIQNLLGHECVIIHDSHALSLSERLHGNAKELSNFVMLDHCIGIGLGLMVEGRFLTGDSGFAGEIGHSPVVLDGELCKCGKKGCLETVASEWAVEERVSKLLGRPVQISEVLELAQGGNLEVMQELERMCDYLAIGVAHVVNILNPGTFFIYGRVFEACPKLFDLLVEKTEELALKPSVAACSFARANGSLLDGTVASVINYLTDSLVPNLEDYLSSLSQGDSQNSIADETLVPS
ncbi:ROK family transcriptional regulator [Bythopirellula polymerisocia]|uniref:N-acetylglucosamine repressor n=1 Tax=Bythopirellula polymerisocia TaxID=2528003 RepID=A0A5C6CXV3_9BACT|nr:ROK family protein [Bythopirellula polymerisocia]TWU29432.1 N-acetylglucosamine repressor [Bythopirellula polymerisocia]